MYSLQLSCHSLPRADFDKTHTRGTHIEAHARFSFLESVGQRADKRSVGEFRMVCATGRHCAMATWPTHTGAKPQRTATPPTMELLVLSRGSSGV